MNKAGLLIDLFKDTVNCIKCEKFSGENKKIDGCDGLINIFQNEQIALNIPSIWTDWINRADSKLMIIGQDWGPYSDMEKLYNKYCKYIGEGCDRGKAWSEIVNEPESMTKKLMTEFIVQSAKEIDIIVDETILDSFFVTNAVLCARKGNNYRGNNNFKPKFCTENCAAKLKKEIEIIKPMVIVTLGYWPFYSIAQSYHIPVYKTLRENLLRYSSDIKNIINISKDNTPIYVLPVYHPTAQVRKADQISYYRLMWELLLTHYQKRTLLEEIHTYDDYREKMGL